MPEEQPHITFADILQRESILEMPPDPGKIDFEELEDTELKRACDNILRATGLEQKLGKKSSVRDKNGNIVEHIEHGIASDLFVQHSDFTQIYIRDLSKGLGGYEYKWGRKVNEGITAFRRVRVLTAPQSGIIQVRGSECVTFFTPVSVTLQGTTEPFHKAVKEAFDRPETVRLMPQGV